MLKTMSYLQQCDFTRSHGDYDPLSRNLPVTKDIILQVSKEKAGTKVDYTIISHTQLIDYF
jgi:hypothetical protein